MAWERSEVARGLTSLRHAVASLLAPAIGPQPLLATADGSLGNSGARPGILFSEAVADGDRVTPGGPDGYGDADLATSSEDSEEERTRLIALVADAPASGWRQARVLPVATGCRCR